jgi:hypothetical protein
LTSGCRLTFTRFADSLNADPAHFILELIQNADDNQYDVPEPKLTFIYRSGGELWICINEVGFNEANLRALCRSATSSKVVMGSQKDSIGEKGIGFKSCFKVADEIWLRSGELQIKFDRHKPLGMIAPEWETFPLHPHLQETTMFRFKIPDQKHQICVVKDIRDLSTSLLLFSRKLRQIDVRIEDGRCAIKEAFSIKRTDSTLSGVELRTLTRYQQQPSSEGQVTKYLTFRRNATNKRRRILKPSIEKSELIVAFPVTETDDPIIQGQPTFNYLPIRKYGLQVSSVTSPKIIGRRILTAHSLSCKATSC